MAVLRWGRGGKKPSGPTIQWAKGYHNELKTKIKQKQNQRCLLTHTVAWADLGLITYKMETVVPTSTCGWGSRRSPSTTPAQSRAQGRQLS